MTACVSVEMNSCLLTRPLRVKNDWRSTKFPERLGMLFGYRHFSPTKYNPGSAAYVGLTSTAGETMSKGCWHARNVLDILECFTVVGIIYSIMENEIFRPIQPMETSLIVEFLEAKEIEEAGKLGIQKDTGARAEQQYTRQATGSCRSTSTSRKTSQAASHIGN